MSAHLKPWTADEFFAWHDHQEARYEFDGEQPVAMAGETLSHGMIRANLHHALRRALGGAAWVGGPGVGLATIGEAVRYPDALVTFAKLVGSAYTAPGAVAVFEIVSPTSSWNDRYIKPREDAAVASLQRYVIFESTTQGVTVLARDRADQPWTLTTLMDDDVLTLPDMGEIPLAAVYDGVDCCEVDPASD